MKDNRHVMQINAEKSQPMHKPRNLKIVSNIKIKLMSKWSRYFNNEMPQQQNWGSNLSYSLWGGQSKGYNMPPQQNQQWGRAQFQWHIGVP